MNGFTMTLKTRLRQHQTSSRISSGRYATKYRLGCKLGLPTAFSRASLLIGCADQQPAGSVKAPSATSHLWR
jgi:hypothetical protein